MNGPGDPVGKGEQEEKQQAEPVMDEAVKQKTGGNEQDILPAVAGQKPVQYDDDGQEDKVIETRKKHAYPSFPIIDETAAKSIVADQPSRPLPKTRAGHGLKNTLDCATFKPMKNAMIAVLLALLLAQAAPADEFKAILGIHASKYLFSSEITYLNRQQKTGLAFGLGYAFEINPKMMLEAHAAFMAKGAKASLEYAPGETASITYSNQALALPLFFKYRLKEGATPYAAIGPEFNFILAHRLVPEHGKSINIADNTSKFIFAVNVALGYELPIGQWGLFAEARYNRWLSDLMKSPDASVKGESVSFLLGGISYL